jgi:two-component system chemotaxis sensor kinase CheA
MKRTTLQVVFPIAAVFSLLAIVEFLYFPGRSLDAHLRALNAKAVALSELTAHGAGPALEFEDDALVKELLNGIARDHQLGYAALYKADGTLLRAVNKANVDLARLPRASDQASAKLVGQHVHVITPVQVSVGDGGTLITGFSTDEMLTRSAQDRKVAGTIALVIFVLGISIALWIGKGLRDIERLNAQLADYAQNLERKVEDRTRELDQRNRGMRLVLDNVAQGFITIDLNGSMAAERSAVVDGWFGPPGPAADLATYLGSYDPSYAQWLRIGLEQLRDDFLPAELTLDQLPKRLQAGERTFDVTYSPIREADALSHLLVVLSNVTQQLARERAEAEQKELVSFFQRVSVDRTGVEEFLAEGAELLASLREERDPVAQKRLVHTLKGNCAVYGLDSISERAHRIEAQMAESSIGLSAEQCGDLVSLWKQVMMRVAWLLEKTKIDTVEVSLRDLVELAARARAGTSGEELARTLDDWQHPPIAARLNRLAAQVVSVARQLGKPEPTVEIEDNGLRLRGSVWSPFWSAMVHVVRNAVDHGIEIAAVRTHAGKSEQGRVKLSARREQGRVVITVSDDGAGVAWERLREKAQKLGLPATSQSELVEAMFHDGLSTRDEASAMSGRGVGLSALRQVVRNLGGTIEVESSPGKGTTFRFTFDESVASRAATPSLSVRRTASLLPRFD